jgi:hypothetical protein
MFSNAGQSHIRTRFRKQHPASNAIDPIATNPNDAGTGSGPPSGVAWMGVVKVGLAKSISPTELILATARLPVIVLPLESVAFGARIEPKNPEVNVIDVAWLKFQSTLSAIVESPLKLMPPGSVKLVPDTLISTC